MAEKKVINLTSGDPSSSYWLTELGSPGERTAVQPSRLPGRSNQGLYVCVFLPHCSCSLRQSPERVQQKCMNELHELNQSRRREKEREVREEGWCEKRAGAETSDGGERERK